MSLHPGTHISFTFHISLQYVEHRRFSSLSILHLFSVGPEASLLKQKTSQVVKQIWTIY